MHFIDTDQLSSIQIIKPFESYDPLSALNQQTNEAYDRGAFNKLLKILFIFWAKKVPVYNIGLNL